MPPSPNLRSSTKTKDLSSGLSQGNWEAWISQLLSLRNGSDRFLLPLQLHIVHYNSDRYLDLKSAVDKPNGLAVLAILMEVRLTSPLVVLFLPGPLESPKHILSMGETGPSFLFLLKDLWFHRSVREATS